MLEYVFFHAQPFEQFVAYLYELGLYPEIENDAECWEARLPEDLDDALSDKIEERYDQLMALNQQLFDQELDEDFHVAGVVVNLNNGKTVYAQV
ncbi:MAG TPA: hypothetical protein ENG92_05240, partial [Thiolapillus brandeum]|nr:hypothetical protein [Thiolapillus brandeum]